MSALLLELAARGTLVSCVVWLLDSALERYQRPQWRRLWWLVVAVAWILPFRLPHRASIPSLPIALPVQFGNGLLAGDEASANLAAHSQSWAHWQPFVFDLWMAGALISFSIIAIRTLQTAHQWSRVRLSTDRELLDLLEDCKADAGVGAPIGLVITHHVSSPALLGWLRPRILVPESLVHAISRDELRGVFLHELAHFRSADIPIQWLFCIGQSLHWFNPMAHLATRRWMYFRELAADATALAWMPATSREAYGHALLAAIREANPLPLPRGALALGESFQQLKLRIIMIAQSQNRARLVWLASLVSVALFALVLLPRTLLADTSSAEQSAKSLAHVGGDNWLDLVDSGKFSDSWSKASAMFKGAVTSDAWSQQVGSVRTPLGAKISRNLVSAAYQKDPVVNGKAFLGEFVIEQFESSFQNLKHATETLSLMKDPDGEWRAAGYYIKPN